MPTVKLEGVDLASAPKSTFGEAVARYLVEEPALQAKLRRMDMAFKASPAMLDYERQIKKFLTVIRDVDQEMKAYARGVAAAAPPLEPPRADVLASVKQLATFRYTPRDLERERDERTRQIVREELARANGPQEPEPDPTLYGKDGVKRRPGFDTGE